MLLVQINSQMILDKFPIRLHGHLFIIIGWGRKESGRIENFPPQY